MQSLIVQIQHLKIEGDMSRMVENIRFVLIIYFERRQYYNNISRNKKKLKSRQNRFYIKHRPTYSPAMLLQQQENRSLIIQWLTKCLVQIYPNKKLMNCYETSCFEKITVALCHALLYIFVTNLYILLFPRIAFYFQTSTIQKTCYFWLVKKLEFHQMTFCGILFAGRNLSYFQEPSWNFRGQNIR